MGRPRIIDSPEEFDRLVDEYVAECKADDEPVLLTGLCLHLGFADKSTLYDYQKRPEFSQSAKRARAIVESNYERLLVKNGGSGPIFALKNFGWSDKQEVEHSGPGGSPLAVNVTRRVVGPDDA